MMRPVEATVVSGKGGTGKTVIVSSLARLLESKVLADCDVDAPDLHLMLKPRVLSTQPFSGGRSASIDPDKCTGCGQCAEHCRFDAVRETAGPDGPRYEVDSIGCEGCAVCYYVCPAGAVEMRDSRNGTLYVSATAFGPLVHARLDPAQENSGKLVSLVRKEARTVARRDGLRYIIVDGPPGIGCPVISSVTGTDLVVIVTEPTVSGFHDCERVVSLARHFGMRTAAVINKYDLNLDASARAEEFFERENTVVLGRIPYGLEVSRAIANATPVVDIEGSPVARELISVGDALEGLLKKIGSEAAASEQ